PKFDFKNKKYLSIKSKVVLRKSIIFDAISFIEEYNAGVIIKIITNIKLIKKDIKENAMKSLLKLKNFFKKGFLSLKLSIEVIINFIINEKNITKMIKVITSLKKIKN
ncbi:MAG: hypothetical protein ACPL1F_07125, partial [bacterium]